LIKEGATGYISCIKNLGDNDPGNWLPAGCPLPTMMCIERRKGKDMPVIEKALVDLHGNVFKAYAAVREKWALLDCYISPGPIQFEGPSKNSVSFLVKPPSIETLLKETEEHEQFEKQYSVQKHFIRDISNLSQLSLMRINEKAPIPDMLEKGSFNLVSIKKYKDYS
jgi:hypothetical protein